MLQLISLVIIYAAMMFIWTFAYLNRSQDKINQAFLVFHSNILIWMVLNNLGEYGDPDHCRPCGQDGVLAQHDVSGRLVSVFHHTGCSS